VLAPSAAETFVRKLLSYQEQRNLYTTGSELLVYQVTTSNVWTRAPLSRSWRDLETWRTFWGLERMDSMLGPPPFQGGDLAARARSALEQLTPADFRLRSGSPGQGAGRDGGDIGADIDLVGPGPAYESWKKTPEYQRWLADTGQIRTNK
jgi:hypothetical protein